MSVAEFGPYVVSGVGVAVALYLARSQRRRNDADTSLTKADTARIANEAAAINERRERDRETYWQTQLDEVRAETANLKKYVNRVVPWVWRAAQKMLAENIDFEPPPQLMPDGDQ